jgi:hypothetical protein
VGRRIPHDYFDFFVQSLEQPEEAQGRAQAITIRAYVRGNRKAIFLFN